MRENGFTLEQVERNSVFDLRGPFEIVERKLAERRRAAAGDGLPARDVDRADARRSTSTASPTRSRAMSTDAPAGGLVIDEQHWDAARVAAPGRPAARRRD